MAAGGHFENAQLQEFAEAFATPPPKLVNTTYVRTQFHGQSPYKKECMQDSVLGPGLIILGSELDTQYNEQELGLLRCDFIIIETWAGLQCPIPGLGQS